MLRGYFLHRAGDKKAGRMNAASSAPALPPLSCAQERAVLPHTGGEVGSLADLPRIIARAMACFSAGDVIAARGLAAGAYDLAKVAGKMAISKDLLAKARALQGDALSIEVKANIRIAVEYDAAQADGTAKKPGRKKNIPDGNVFTLEQAGLDAKQIFHARQLRDAELAEPGIAERAIAARLAQGLEPTRASVRGIGTRSASKDERGDDFYQTPKEAIVALLCVERFSRRVWEPSCGHGAISKVMEEAGYDLLLSDLIDRGCATQQGEVQQQIDFLLSASSFASDNGFEDCDIVSNPPFGLVNDYIHHALTAHRPRKMAMLLNLNMMCGADNEKRNFWLETWPPARVWVFSRRLPMMHRDGWDGPLAGSSMNAAWFVWERSEDACADQCQGGSDVKLSGPGCGWAEVYGTGDKIWERIDWKDYSETETRGPADA
jgi:hypothetical protein